MRFIDAFARNIYRRPAAYHYLEPGYLFPQSFSKFLSFGFIDVPRFFAFIRSIYSDRRKRDLRPTIYHLGSVWNHAFKSACFGNTLFYGAFYTHSFSFG